jgi:hypothetical protein
MENETATKIVPDLETNLVQYVREKLQEKLNSSSIKPKWNWQGAPVYEIGDSENGYVVLWDNNEVQYFVRVRRIRHNGFRLGRQVLLWRNPKSEVTNGFAQKVFFSVLLPKYGALIADKEQTKNGSAFWGNAIVSAFDRNLHVYFLDRRSRKTQLTELLDEDDLGKYRKELWGTTPSHLLTFAIISKTPLVLRKKGS